MRQIKGVTTIDSPVYYRSKELLDERLLRANGLIPDSPENNTIAHSILSAHNISAEDHNLKLRFDAAASHDITYVGIIQTARASGLTEFPIPYILTNCHNSLCAVGGTINEDDHVFGLSAAKKYGGVFVPAHIAVIHQYMREMYAGCGKMILGSDSHTRYGAIGTLAIGEGGPEIVKQLLSRTYDIPRPEVAAVYLEGAPCPGVGPQDVALSIIGAVFENGFVKNCVMEFIGPAIGGLSMDFRIGIDVMTTETTCLSSIWETDETVRGYLEIHGRPEDYKPLSPVGIAKYDKLVRVDLSKIRPMIALPFHPSNVYSISELNQNLSDILPLVEREAKEFFGADISLSLTGKIKDKRLHVDQGVIAGCAGGSFENLCAAASVLEGADIGSGEFALSAYPASQPIYLELLRNGAAESLTGAGAIMRTAFCGPCFGAGDVPANNSLSVRHTTRNFPSREGSKPSERQVASVALMDARSVAATAKNKGVLTGADTADTAALTPVYHFDNSIYQKRVFQGKPDRSIELKYGPNIADWPDQIPLSPHILLRCVSVITDPVTTTDELIPSGETSSYRSNPYKLAEFTLSRKDPGYVARAKEVRSLEERRRQGALPEELAVIYGKIGRTLSIAPDQVGIGSVVCAIKPGDGSAREQAASCQRVLGGLANIARDYATKRYRSNLINWGMLPFLWDGSISDFQVGDHIFVPHVRQALMAGKTELAAYLLRGEKKQEIILGLHEMTVDEREIIAQGCLINYYASQG